MKLIRKFGYFCDIQHLKIITEIMNNIVPGLIRFLETSYSFKTIYTNNMVYTNNLRFYYVTKLPM